MIAAIKTVSDRLSCLALVRGWCCLMLLMGMGSFLVSSDVAGGIKLIGCLCLALLLGLSWSGTFRQDGRERQWGHAGVAVTALLCLSTLAWAWYFDSVQNSDFGVYFRCGQAVSKDIGDWVGQCQSQYLHPNLIYWTRSLLYTGLLNAFDARGYAALKVFNAFCHCVTLVVWYVGVRKYRGNAEACLAVALFGLFPEYWFTTTLASTDNLALLFIGLFLLLLPRLTASFAILPVVVLAMVIAAADLLRTIGVLMLLAAILFAMVRGVRQWRWYFVVNLLCMFIGAIFLGKVTAGLAPAGIADPLLLMKSLSTVDFLSRQDFHNNYQWGEYYWFAVPSADRAALALHKLWYELLYGFDAFPRYLWGKSETLFAGFGYYWLSAFAFDGFNPDTVATVARSTIPYHAEVVPYLGAVVFVYAGLVLKSLLVRRATPELSASFCWIAIFGLLVLGFGETQPRYLAVLAPALSMLAASALVSNGGENDGDGVSAVRSGLYGGISIVCIYLIAAGVLWLVQRQEGNPMDSLQLASGDGSSVQCDSKEVTLVKNYKAATLTFPKERPCAVVLLPFASGKSEISFFLSGTVFPFIWQKPPVSSASFSIIQGEHVLETAPLADLAVIWRKVRLDPAGGAVRLLLRRADSEREEALRVSWIRVSTAP